MHLFRRKSLVWEGSTDPFVYRWSCLSENAMLLQFFGQAKRTCDRRFCCEIQTLCFHVRVMPSWMTWVPSWAPEQVLLAVASCWRHCEVFGVCNPVLVAKVDAVQSSRWLDNTKAMIARCLFLFLMWVRSMLCQGFSPAWQMKPKPQIQKALVWRKP